MTAFTTSVMTALVGISSLSTPGNPSARVGPTLRCKTGLRNSSACLSRLEYDPYGGRLKIKHSADDNMGTNIPKGGISCERSANNEEPVSVFDDTITFFAQMQMSNVKLTFFCFEEDLKENNKKNFLPLWRFTVKLTCDP
jgi:hypothetical protein